MPKIVILGSLRNGDYEVTAPKKVCEDYHNEAGYQKATERFYPAIDETDVVIVYGETGEHTQRDIDYALKQDKRIIFIPLNHEAWESGIKKPMSVINSFSQAENLAGGWQRD